ncbi:hypothetical protein LCGC14_2133000, partial [marine sediment metagenome]
PQQYVLVISPNGGEAWAQTTDQTVKWRSDGFAGNVDVYYSSDGGSGWNLLADDVANVDAWLWGNIATPLSEQYLLRIWAHDNNGIADASDAVFTVTEAIFWYYVDDNSNDDDEYTPSAIGNNGNDGLSPVTPKASIRAVLETYDLNAGDRIYVDTGNYSVTANILIGYADSGVTIIGPIAIDHEALLTRGNTASGNYVFELDNAHYVTIKYLSMTNAYTGVYATNASTHLTLDANVIYDNDYAGLHIQDYASSDAVIMNNRFYGTTGVGTTDQNYGVYSRGADPTVTENTAYHTPLKQRDGLYFYDIGTGTFADNIVYNNNAGMTLRGAQMTVSGNAAYDNAYRGIAVTDTHSGQYSPVFDNQSHDNFTGLYSGGYEDVYGNFTYNNSTHGIDGSYQYWRTIHDNDSYENQNGINVQTGEVAGNRVWGNTNVGIQASYSTATIEGNTIYGNAYGVYVNANYQTVTVRNNVIYDNSIRGIEANRAMSSGVALDIVNNTVYEVGANAVHLTNSSKNVHLRNNILWAEGAYELYVEDNSQAGFTSDSNLFYGHAGDFLYWQQDFTSLVDWFLELGFDGSSRVNRICNKCRGLDSRDVLGRSRD